VYLFERIFALSALIAAAMVGELTVLRLREGKRVAVGVESCRKWRVNW
jgi:hypothetical protein